MGLVLSLARSAIAEDPPHSGPGVVYKHFGEERDE